MNVSLTPELEQFIQSQVESGKYNSPEEVIIRGVQLLSLMERFYQERVEELPKSRTGWMPGFFEQTAGCLADDPIVIDDEGDFEERERLE